MHLTITKVPKRGLVAGMVLLKRKKAFTSRIANNRTPSQRSTEANLPCSSGVDEASRGEQSKSLKRGAQELEERAMKQPRLASASLAGESSFTALRSHFLSLRLDERLQFLSWLFEGALASCAPASNKSMRPAISDPHKKIEQTRPGRSEGSKGMETSGGDGPRRTHAFGRRVSSRPGG